MNEQQLPAAPLPEETTGYKPVQAVQATNVEDEAHETDPYGADVEVEEPVPAFQWQASEFVHHHKGAAWYGALAGGVVVLVFVAILFKFWLSIGVFIAMGAAIAVYANKAPRILTYEIDAHSLSIDGKDYPYRNFRSFGVISDLEWHTIDLEPTQRFMPRLTVLFSDEDFDAIVNHLSEHLPRTDRSPDLIERITRYLRF